MLRNCIHCVQPIQQYLINGEIAHLLALPRLMGFHQMRVNETVAGRLIGKDTYYTGAPFGQVP